MKIINISGENGISTLDTFSIKRITNYLYKMTISKVEDSSTGQAYYIDSAGNKITVPAGIPLYFNYKFWNIGSWHQQCGYPYDVSQWSLNGVTRSVSGNTFWGFTGYLISATGAAWNGIRFFMSSNNNIHPTGKQYFSLLVRFNTSTKLRLYAYDETIVNYCAYEYASGVWTSIRQAAGTLSIDSFAEISNGVYLLKASIIWTNPNNSIVLYIGPASTSTGSIELFSCLYLNELGHVFPFTGPGNTTLVSRAGTIEAPITTQLEHALDGTKDCKFAIELLTKFSHSDFPVSHTESILYSGIINILTLSTDASGNGYINFSDGTNTASVAYNWVYDDEITIEVPLGYNASEANYKMQLIVNGTVSALTAFDGSLDPDTQMTIGRNNDYLFGVAVKILPLKQSDWS